MGLWLDRHGIATRLNRFRSSVIVIVLCLVVYATLWGTNHRGHIIHGPSPESVQYHRFASWVGLVPHARVVYLGSHCIPACGDAAESLPGCRHWHEQSYSTQLMKSWQEEQVRIAMPDFVVVRVKDSTHIAMLSKMGYHLLPTYIAEAPFNNKALYTKHHFSY